MKHPQTMQFVTKLLAESARWPEDTNPADYIGHSYKFVTGAQKGLVLAIFAQEGPNLRYTDNRGGSGTIDPYLLNSSLKIGRMQPVEQPGVHKL